MKLLWREAKGKQGRGQNKHAAAGGRSDDARFRSVSECAVRWSPERFMKTIEMRENEQESHPAGVAEKRDSKEETLPRTEEKTRTHAPSYYES